MYYDHFHVILSLFLFPFSSLYYTVNPLFLYYFAVLDILFHVPILDLATGVKRSF